MFSTLAWQALVLRAMRLSSRLRRPGSSVDIYPLRLVPNALLSFLPDGRNVEDVECVALSSEANCYSHLTWELDDCVFPLYTVTPKH
ncbi:hypothetical protein GGI35DRAFT_177572 [Trichoderma velutinum]